MNSQDFKKQGNKTGALKRKLGIKRGEVLKPGDLMSRASKLKKVAIKGLV